MPFRLFRPILAGARPRDRIVACAGAAICLALTVFICAQFPLAESDLPLIVAPMGASAVLIFAVPASPLAQPWSLLGGNTVSALVGVSCALLLGPTGLAASAAGALHCSAGRTPAK